MILEKAVRIGWGSHLMDKEKKMEGYNACQPCRFSVYLWGWWTCNYMEITGARRPCPSMYKAGTCKCFEARHAGDPKRSRPMRLKPQGREQPVVQLDKDGSVVAIWPSIKDAAKAVGAQAGNISRACRNGAKTAKGFGWKYVDSKKEAGAD